MNERGLIKTEIKQLSSRYANGQLMYPGLYKFIWCQISIGSWMLLSIIPHEE